MRSHEANADVLAGWYWHTELGPRTCVACVAMHGTRYPVSAPGPYGHPQCRCARVPITKSWAELGFEGIKETRPKITHGPTWLANQPEAVQRSVMGDRRFEAWTAGDYPPSDWAVRRENPDWRPSYQIGPLPKKK